MDLYNRIAQTAGCIRDLCESKGVDVPKTALVLGSGLGELASEIVPLARIRYDDIPHWPRTGVAGHAGLLTLGTLNNVPLICLQGRVHSYEGIDREAIVTPIRALKLAGVDTLVLTNAAGSLDPAMPVGSIMAISDHINHGFFHGRGGTVSRGGGNVAGGMMDTADGTNAGLVRAVESNVQLTMQQADGTKVAGGFGEFFGGSVVSLGEAGRRDAGQEESDLSVLIRTGL